MTEDQQFCLRWNNFQTNITSQFEALRDEEDFVDVTLACEGQRLKAHKVVLSACSPYFKELFRSNPCKHPILFMRDVEFQHLQSLVEFMYAGEVNVAQAQLSSFLRTAESLQIRGLTESPQRHRHDYRQPPPPDSLSSTAKVQSQLQGFSTSMTQKRSTAAHHHHHHHPHTNNNRPQSNSPRNHSNMSPGGDNGSDEIFSLSPPTSPSPAKRACPTDAAEDSRPSSRGVSSQDGVTGHRGHDLEAYKADSPEILEPKIEAPDYSSDGESKTDSTAMAGAFMGLDNSLDMNPTFASLHGAMEMLPGTSSQSFMGEASQDSGQVDHRKLHSLDPRPCPICNRMYSNLSNLRQHVRLIHNPQTVACPLCSKPFKTKLYLKRHLMSFHELCTSPNNPKAGPQVPDFFPPPPQVFLATQHNTGSGEDKGNFSSGVSVKRDLQTHVSDYYQNMRMYQNPINSHTGDERLFVNNHQQDGMLYPSSQPQACKEDRGNFHAHSSVKLQEKMAYHTQQSVDNTAKSLEPSVYMNAAPHENNDGRPLVHKPNQEEYHGQQPSSNGQEMAPAHDKSDSYMDSGLEAESVTQCTSENRVECEVDTE